MQRKLTFVTDDVETVAEAVGRLRAIESSSGRNDGVVCFARLYREVTEGVEERLNGATFANSPFLAALDVRFAGLFFSAFDTYTANPAHTPSAWRPLFHDRGRHGIAPLQFALAGMNAHINRDLPVALAETAHACGLELQLGSREHADFVRINTLLSLVEARVKASFLTGWASIADRLLHRVHRIDDVIAMWDIGQARDAAWTNGQALQQLRGQAELSAAFLATLDRMVGQASRGLLIPADSALQRLGRLFS